MNLLSSTHGSAIIRFDLPLMKKKTKSVLHAWIQVPKRHLLYLASHFAHDQGASWDTRWHMAGAIAFCSFCHCKAENVLFYMIFQD